MHQDADDMFATIFQHVNAMGEELPWPRRDEQLLRRNGAEVPLIGRNAHPWEIEPVSIPASTDLKVRGRFAFVVLRTANQQPVEHHVVQVEELTTELLRQSCRPQTMFGIRSLVFPARIVENCKESDKLNIGPALRSNRQPVFLDLFPVDGSVGMATKLEVLFTECP